jgi:hypothetical protein
MQEPLSQWDALQIRHLRMGPWTGIYACDNDVGREGTNYKQITNCYIILSNYFDQEFALELALEAGRANSKYGNSIVWFLWSNAIGSEWIE